MERDGSGRPRTRQMRSDARRDRLGAQQRGEGQAVWSRAFYVWDEDARHALQWAAELAAARVRGR